MTLIVLHVVGRGWRNGTGRWGTHKPGVIHVLQGGDTLVIWNADSTYTYDVFYQHVCVHARACPSVLHITHESFIARGIQRAILQRGQ